MRLGGLPVVFRSRGYRFFFYSNEGDPREPVHIHVQKASSEAKFWVGNDIVLARSNGFDAKSLRLIAELVEENKQVIEDSWHEYFG